MDLSSFFASASSACTPEGAAKPTARDKATADMPAAKAFMDVRAIFFITALLWLKTSPDWKSSSHPEGLP
jgi:hypothetical protein